MILVKYCDNIMKIYFRKLLMNSKLYYNSVSEISVIIFISVYIFLILFYTSYLEHFNIKFYILCTNSSYKEI